jgi:hypothetical protein
LPIELKNALAAWKKAKPLTLTKTGISEALRELPDPAKMDLRKDVPALEKVKKALEVGVANKHIAAQKAAHECVKQILASVNTQILAYSTRRINLNRILERIIDAGNAFVKDPNPKHMVTLKGANAEFNKYLANVVGLDATYAQVPTRILLLAENYLKAQPKGGTQFEGVKKEMEAYMKAHPKLVI